MESQFLVLNGIKLLRVSSPIPFLILEEKLLTLLSMVLAAVLPFMALIMLKYVSPTPNLLAVFIIKVFQVC